MSKTTFNRRELLALSGAATLTGILGGHIPVQAAEPGTLTIAYQTGLPSFDPTSGPSGVNPMLQAIYRSILDQFIAQGPDLAFQPGLITKWGWNDAKTQVFMDVREGVTWHDGSKFTPEDIVWSLQRMAKPETANAVGFVWTSLGNYKISGNRITADVIQYDPTIFKWMGFLTAFVMPKAYYEKVGAAGFEKKPIGTGPYMFDAYEGGSFLRLKANPKYFGGKPAFDTVIFKFVTDPTSRVAEIESGSSDVTLEIPYEDYDRLKAKQGLVGVATPIADVGLIFINSDTPVLQDKNVRLAAHMSIDKEAIIKRLLRGYGKPLSTLQTPEYTGYDASIKVPYDLEQAKKLLAASGYSPEKPAKFTIQTTRGYKPKDYEMIQAIVGMWSKIGIEATIEVVEIAKHIELRVSHKLAPMAFYNWGNALGDITTSTGHAMFGPSPHSSWKGKDVDAMMGPLWGEKDEAKRIAGWKAVSKYIAEQGYIIPLLQYVQPIVYKNSLKVTPNISGALQPTLVAKA